MFKWFMAKTLITKIIIIVTSSVLVIGGATAGAIIIPKQIEVKKEEQRQEQIRLENEEDIANISIELKTDKISIPYKGVTQGITIERYENLDEAIPYEEGEILDKAKLTEVLKELFIENYTGGELTVDFDENINGYTKRGDYPITFTVTSEKGNTKSETAIIEVYNYVSVILHIPEDITITKGTPVDIMEDVSFTSHLPKEAQGHIETEGTVDVNTVGTYTIIYRYIPKEGEHEAVMGQDYGEGRTTRTYQVVEKLSDNENSNVTTAPNSQSNNNSSTQTSNNSNNQSQKEMVKIPNFDMGFELNHYTGFFDKFGIKYKVVKGQDFHYKDNTVIKIEHNGDYVEKGSTITITVADNIYNMDVKVSTVYLLGLADLGYDYEEVDVTIKINGTTICNKKLPKVNEIGAVSCGTYKGKQDGLKIEATINGKTITKNIHYAVFGNAGYGYTEPYIVIYQGGDIGAA